MTTSRLSHRHTLKQGKLFKKKTRLRQYLWPLLIQFFFK